MSESSVILPMWWGNRIESIQQYIGAANGDCRPQWPLELFLEVSNVCDLRCAMCPTFSGLSPSRFFSIKEQERGFLDFATLKNQLDAILQRALIVHCFSYGEPTLHPHFNEILEQLSHYRVLIDFFTNGMHLNTALCEQLVQCHVFAITVSFSGANKADYESIYLESDFDQVLNGLRQLTDVKRAHNSAYPRIEINSLAFEHHVQNLPDFVDLMASCGAEIIHLKTLQTFETTKELRGHCSIFRHWIDGQFIQSAQEHAKQHGIILSCEQYLRTAVNDETSWQQKRGDVTATLPLNQLANHAQQIEPTRPPIGYQTPPTVNCMTLSPTELAAVLRFEPLINSSDQTAPFYCFEPFKTMYIRRSGDIKPCCFAQDQTAPTLGQLNTNSAVAIWNGAPWQAIRDGIIQQRYPQALCEICLRDQYGPRQQVIPDQLQQYQRWLSQTWQIELPFIIPNTTLPNHKIVQCWQRTTDEQTLLATIRRLTPFGVSKHWLTGHLDGLNHYYLHGWLYSPQTPKLRLRVTVNVNGQMWKTLIADQLREDVKAAGHGDGQYGFGILIPDWPSGTLIEVYLADTPWLLGRIETTTATDTQNNAPSSIVPVDLLGDPLLFPVELPTGHESECSHNTSAPPQALLLPYDAGIYEQEILRYFHQSPSDLAAEITALVNSGAILNRPLVVIAFTNRSGSNLLAESLAATGLVTCAEEALNLSQVINTCDDLHLTQLGDYFVKLHHTEPETPALAIKLSWDQLYFLTHIGVLPYLWPDVRFMWMMRADLLAQSLSLCVARQMQCWKGAYPTVLLNQHLATLTAADLIAPLNEITEAHRQFWRWFAVYGIEPVIVEYNELTAAPMVETRRVLTELNLLPNGWQWQFDATRIQIIKQRTPAMEQCLLRLRQQLQLFPELHHY
ncbi:SPASM domain-containing protein [Rhodoferax sp. 4810]|uniref:SPASM domain-containing protein n=1 Tax=Thiospirillum jenense TaxID=1653858 RepID=A0A839HFP6_9GAMM|nr:Stf0 family sulfotransferase [Thiospirillum jenense]MBB1073530.1 SPASM domain-containing protein [Rhodoferax jenense]MBB1126018.1 SPASM domain-containing protein [Thiospirillum jenense]